MADLHQLGHLEASDAAQRMSKLLSRPFAACKFVINESQIFEGICNEHGGKLILLVTEKTILDVGHYCRQDGDIWYKPEADICGLYDMGDYSFQIIADVIEGKAILTPPAGEITGVGQK